MNKKILKVLSIIILFFIVFFVNVNGVFAATEKCKMKTPFTFVGDNNKLIDIKVTSINNDFSFDYWCGVLNVANVADLGILFLGPADCWNNSTNTTISYINPEALTLVFNEKTKTKGKDDESYKVISMNLGILAYDNEIQYEQELKINKGSYNFDSCSEYTKVVCDDDYNCDVSTATADEYKEYLQNQGSFFTKSGMIYNPAYVTFDKNMNFYEYLQAGIVFRNTTNSTKYPNKNLTQYNNYIKKSRTTNISDVGDSISVFIDVDEVDSRSYDSIYYEATKDRMLEVYEDVLSSKYNSDTMDSIKKNALNKWFYYSGRYLFEEDLELFQKFLKLIYETNKIDSIKPEEFEKMNEIISQMIKGEEIQEEKAKIEGDEDLCEYLCPSCLKKSDNYDLTSCSKCKIENTYAKTCPDCLKKSIDECKKLDAMGRATSTCINNKLKTCMGTDIDLLKIKQEYNDKLEKEEQEVADAIGTLSKELKTVTAAKLEELNVKFNSKYYPVCEDWEDFHTIYKMMIIIAPILVIILGSLDFIKSMAASDGEKMKKFREKFTKRILALVLLILIPIIVSFLTSSIAGLNNTIMNYIVNGCN